MIFTFDVIAKTNQSSDIVSLLLERNSQVVEMTASRNWTAEQLAQEIMEQRFPNVPDNTFRRRFTVDAHQEQVLNPETGEMVDVWVVDSVVSALLPEDTAKDGIDSLPGWASWTATEAEDWIDVNVMDLASAKTALKAIAKMVVWLRTIALRGLQ